MNFNWTVFVSFTCLFACLFWDYRLTREFLIYMETSPSPVKGCKFWLMLGTHEWPLSSEGSSACHTYCDIGHPFIMVISDDPWHTDCRAFSSGAVTTCFNDLGLSRLGFDHPTFRLRRSHPLRHRRGLYHVYTTYCSSTNTAVVTGLQT